MCHVNYLHFKQPAFGGKIAAKGFKKKQILSAIKMEFSKIRLEKIARTCFRLNGAASDLSGRWNYQPPPPNTMKFTLLLIRRLAVANPGEV